MWCLLCVSASKLDAFFVKIVGSLGILKVEILNYFLQRQEAEDLNHLSQGKKTHKQMVYFPLLCKYFFVPRYKYCLPFLVEMSLVASVIQSKSLVSLDVSNVLMLVSYECKRVRTVF